jgi:hypothetical protein
MTHEQFEREKTYRVALTIAKSMLNQGLISDDEYGAIDAMLIAQFQPVFGGLCA